MPLVFVMAIGVAAKVVDHPGECVRLDIRVQIVREPEQRRPVVALAPLCDCGVMRRRGCGGCQPTRCHPRARGERLRPCRTRTYSGTEAGSTFEERRRSFRSPATWSTTRQTIAKTVHQLPTRAATLPINTATTTQPTLRLLIGQVWR